MSGSLFMKQSSGLVIRSFQHLRGGAARGLPSFPEYSFSHLTTSRAKSTSEFSFSLAVRRFSSSHCNYDTPRASTEENDAILRIREREAARKNELFEDESSSRPETDTQEPEQGTRRDASAIGDDANAHHDEEHLSYADDPADSSDAFSLPPRTEPKIGATSDTRKESNLNANANVIDRLKKLSMTDVSRYSKVDMSDEPSKPPAMHYNPRLLKVLSVKNRLKSGRGGDGYGYNNYNNSYDRPNYNNRREMYRGGDDDDEFDEPRQNRRYSTEGRSPSHNNNRDYQRRRNKFGYEDDEFEDEDDEDADFDPSRKRTASNRLTEQAQIRRGGGTPNTTSRRARDEDDEEYEQIIRNRFANRRENSHTKAGYDE